MAARRYLLINFQQKKAFGPKKGVFFQPLYPPPPKILNVNETRYQHKFIINFEKKMISINKSNNLI